MNDAGVAAPLLEAQIVKTALLSSVAHQMDIASKAVRVAIACGDRAFADFASLHARGSEAAVSHG